MKTHTGGCLCGKVRYSLRGEPFRYGVCHCADCRKESGSVMTVWAQWRREDFELIGAYETYKGRSFCPTCGSRLFNLQSDAVEIRVGGLDDAPTGLGAPPIEAWTIRREPWLAPVPGAEQSERDPPKPGSTGRM